jgi:hypothetical protein
MKEKLLTIVIALSILATTSNAQNDSLTASPNPFTTSTDLTIYNLTNDTVTFNIYNLYGQVVATFFDSTVLTGTITVTFNADSLPNGTYFAFLTKNSEKHSRKLVKSQTATGLSPKKFNANSINIYPNPTSDILTISTSLELAGFELYDLQGRQLMQSNGQQRTLDINNLSNGQYLLYCRTENKTYIKKIIKK